MMVSMQPQAPHLASGAGAVPPGSGAGVGGGMGATASSTLLSGAATPTDMFGGAMGGNNSAAMNLLSGLDIPIHVPVPPSLDAALLPSGMVANYLRAARLRLLPELPGGFYGLSTKDSMWSWWCRVCGALPDGWTATQKGTPSGSGSRTPGGRKKKKKGAAAGTKRTADGDIKEGSDSCAEVVDFERELKRTLEVLASSSAGDPLPPARRPPSSPLDRRRKPAACNTCGSPFARPRTTITLPPARFLARTRSSASEPPPSLSNTPDADEAPVQVDLTYSSDPSEAPSPLSGPDLTPPPPRFTPDMIRAPRPPNLWNTPSLQHIPTSPGDLPTYPRPPVVPPPGPSGTSLPVRIPPGAGLPPPAKKRKKKSGLAKLLAQNAEREAENKGSGNWGLG